MPQARLNSHQIIWDEVWFLREDVQDRFGCQVEVKLVPPAPRTAKNYVPAQVCAIAHTFGKTPRAIAQRKVFVSSVRGAATYEAAAHRALSELYWCLEEMEAGATRQAAF